MTAWRRRSFGGVWRQGSVDDGDCIIISTFGCNNGRFWRVRRVAYAMAKDGLFFPGDGKVNKHGVPGVALVYQGIWIVV